MKLGIAGVTLLGVTLISAVACADDVQRPVTVSISLSNARPGGQGPGVSAVKAVGGQVTVCAVDAKGNFQGCAARPLAVPARVTR